MRYKEQHRPIKAPFAYIRVPDPENQTAPHPGWVKTVVKGHFVKMKCMIQMRIL